MGCCRCCFVLLKIGKLFNNSTLWTTKILNSEEQIKIVKEDYSRKLKDLEDSYEGKIKKLNFKKKQIKS